MTVIALGEFMGKFVFRSGAKEQGAFLSVFALQDEEGEKHYFPAMVAARESLAAASVTVYRSPDGSARLQLDERWVGLDLQAGCLVLDSDPANAATLRLGGERFGQTWEVLAAGNWRPVVFYPQTSQAILTINSGRTAESRFEPTTVTPSLATLVASRDGRGVDLTGVVLDGVRATGVDFTGARFAGASLRGADLSGCDLYQADFRQARLDGVSFSTARLDQASLVGATLAAPGWGVPRSARDIDLSHCQANGAILGGPSPGADFTGAKLVAGDFTNADLSGLQLRKANLREATLTGCRLDDALLDDADLTGVFALKASLRRCSLKNIVGGNANFTAANLSEANLSQARLDSKVYLFDLPLSHASHLQSGLVGTPLLAAFRQRGIDLATSLTMRALVPGRRWQIGERSEGYVLMGGADTIAVFRTDTALRPAVFYRAICRDTQASGAHLGGADLRAVQWYGDDPRLDSADLDEAALSNSLLVSLDLSRAFLSGADLSGSVLIGAKMTACTIQSDAGGRAFSLEGAQIQGAHFSDSTLVDVRLINAGVALDSGVPLFSLPPSAWDDLTPAGIAALAPRFALAGYPLGSSPTLEVGRCWAIDNESDPEPTYRRVYSVRESRGQLYVYDGAGSTKNLFALPEWAQLSLDEEHPDDMLIDEFRLHGYNLSPKATITADDDPKIRTSANAGIVGPFGYSSFRLVRHGQQVQVYGMAPLLMRDWQAYGGGVGFGATERLDAAMSEYSIGPAGYLKQALTSGALDREAFFTAMPRLS